MKTAPLPFLFDSDTNALAVPSRRKSEENQTRTVEQNLPQKSALAYSGQR